MSATTKKLPDFGPSITLFRQIADQSTMSLLTEGPVHPDHKLLELCAEALHYFKQAERSMEARNLHAWIAERDPKKQKEMMDEDNRLLAERYAAEARGKPHLPNITKLKATTAAGIYAKAAVVRASKTAATSLAMSLAQDLLDCPGLREVLWPAGQGDAA